MAKPADGARAAFTRRAWRQAYDEFVAAGNLTEVEDVERLAVAAHLISAQDWVDRWSDAYRAYEERGEYARAARCALWAAYGLLTGGLVALGGGWLARAHELLERVDGLCPEHGLALVPEAIVCCDDQPFRARELFKESASIGRAHADHDVLAIALMGQGQACLACGAVRDALAALDSAMLIVTSERVSPLAEGIVYCGVIDACQQTLELRRAAEWTAVLSRWCDEQPDLVPFRGQCLVHRSEVMQLQGNWVDALEEAWRARAHVEGTPLAGEAAYREGELHSLMGSVTDAEACYRAAAELGRDPQPGLSLLRLVRGDTAAAVNAIRRASTEPTTAARRVELLAAAVEVLVSVDADDDVEGFCQHWHRSLSRGVAVVGAGPSDAVGRTVMGHARADRLLIRPTHGDRAGAGSEDGQVPFRAPEPGPFRFRVTPSPQTPA